MGKHTCSADRTEVHGKGSYYPFLAMDFMRLTTGQLTI